MGCNVTVDFRIIIYIYSLIMDEEEVPSYEDSVNEIGVLMLGDDSALTKVMIVEQNMLDCLGRHPIAQSHTYLYLRCNGKGISNIDILQDYPLLVYVDISDNDISNLDVFEKLTCLQQLNARFVVVLCNTHHQSRYFVA